jgi:hypothetical protein
VAIGDISIKGRRHYLLNVVQIPLIGHNQARSAHVAGIAVHGAHDGCAGVSGKGIGLENRGQSRVEARQIGKSAPQQGQDHNIKA